MICPECRGKGTAIYYCEIPLDENNVVVKKYEDICHTCHGGGQKPKTNADRIRAMSDEELARTFAQTGNCPPSPEYGHNCERCSKCWLDYLRQSVKDGEGE